MTSVLTVVSDVHNIIVSRRCLLYQRLQVMSTTCNIYTLSLTILKPVYAVSTVLTLAGEEEAFCTPAGNYVAPRVDDTVE